MIHREEPKVFFEGQFVFTNIFLTKITPVAGGVPGKGLENVLLGKRIERVSRDYRVAQGELRFGHSFVYHIESLLCLINFTWTIRRGRF